MSEENGTLDVVADEVVNGKRRATFYGMDWGRHDGTSLRCPQCSTVHRFKTRYPKRCRVCDLKFVYTASSEKPTK